MLNGDYRNSKWCATLTDVPLNKEIFERKIRTEHPRAKIMYSMVKKYSLYNDNLFEIYNYKCAYCGIKLGIIPKSDFEIDHFIAESTFDDKAKAGEVKNLVLACRKCNRAKSNFFITDEYTTYLSPDISDGISNIFYRDSDYSIKINDAFSKDTTINAFYEKIKFGDLTRRLDYLLLNIEMFEMNIENKSLKRDLLFAKAILLKKRNIME